MNSLYTREYALYIYDYFIGCKFEKVNSTSLDVAMFHVVKQTPEITKRARIHTTYFLVISVVILNADIYIDFSRRSH